MDELTSNLIVQSLWPDYDFGSIDSSAGSILSLLIAFRVMIFLSLILLTLIILFMYIYCTTKDHHTTKTKKTKDFKHDLLTWKTTYDKMKIDQKSASKSLRVRFYIYRLLSVIILLWIALELYILDFYSQYIVYGQYVYIAVIIIEYCFYFYGLSERIKVNYNKENNDKTCLMIPFGGSKLMDKLKYIDNVIKNALVHFDKSAIFLLHNGGDYSPKIYKEVRDIARKHGIRYVYTPVPNKTHCIATCAEDYAMGFDQVLIMDDDVMLPSDMFIPTLPEDVACAAYPICASIPKYNKDDTCGVGCGIGYERLITSLQSMEYVMAGLLKISQASWNITKSSTISHHGAAGLWKRKHLIKVLSSHDGVFDGEDLLMGIIALDNKYRMIVVDDCLIPTETPKKMTGAGGLIKQRINSWDYIILKYLPVYIKLLFTTGIMEHFILKIFILHELWTIFIDLQRVPFMIYIIYVHPVNFILFALLVSIVNIGMVFWCNYVIIPYHYRSTLVSIFIYPFYKYVLVAFRIIGELKYLFKYTSTRCRNPIMIKSLPKLPNILSSSDWTLDNFDEIEWDKIWSDTDYARKTLRIKREIKFKPVEKQGENVDEFDAMLMEMDIIKHDLSEMEMKRTGKKFISNV